MEINITRAPSVKGATIGRLSIDGLFLCYTLEDQVREPAFGRPCGNGFSASVAWQQLVEWVKSWKIQNVTAIPRGRYKIVLHDSPHFGCVLPMLVDVPGYEYVLIHWGNAAKDTEGCILVGLTTQANLIYQSKAAFALLFPKIKAALAAKQEVFLTVC